MASLTVTQFLSLPRHSSALEMWHSNWPFYPSLNTQSQRFRLQTKWSLTALSKKKVAESLAEDAPNEDQMVVRKKTTKTPKRAATRTRKKVGADTPEENSESLLNADVTSLEGTSASDEDSKKTPRRTRKKAAITTSSVVNEEKAEKKVRRQRKTKKKVDDLEDVGSESELSDGEEFSFASTVEDSDEEMDLAKYEEDDISSTYGWPPLVCCFGAAQHAFVPSGRPASRLIDYEIHDRMKDALWAPEKFVRAPGGSAGSVAIALASIGGKVAFMGKLGNDEYGEAMLYFLNVNNVQTRSIRTDSKRATAMSQMKIAKRGRLRTSSVKACAEDSLSMSDINIDVLKEAKMFYFNTHSLLDRNMRSTTLKAIKISKKLGGVIFYDVNLPLPLWHSSEETKIFLLQVWSLADFIEVTKQELEFLCGIKPAEEFDTRNNDKSKFIHYKPEVIKPLWHENLKVLFVTNGTSKIHYYTSEHNGAVNGMEDPPITPFTCDMSVAGDGIVAALLRMLTVQPHLVTDKGYLERTIKYAVDCGMIDQWLVGRIRGFPPNEDMEEEIEPDPNGIRSVTEKEYRTVKLVS